MTTLRGSLRRWNLRYPRRDLLGVRTAGPIDPAAARSFEIVIPHWRAPAWCRETVDALLAQEGAEVRVHVVDNSSADEPFDAPTGVTVHAPSRNLGFAGAINLELERWLASDDDTFFVIMSHDCLLHPGALRVLGAALESDPALGIVGPRSRGPEPDAPDGPDVVVETVPWSSGSCLVLRRPCIEAIGLLDEELGTYDEDVDLCLRAWDAGWKVGHAVGVVMTTYGTIATDRQHRVSANHVLLAGKRRGAVAAGAEALLQVKAAAAAGARSVRVPAGSADRARLRAEARQRLRGAAEGLRHRRADRN